MPLVRASLCYFGLVFGAGFVLGSVYLALLMVFALAPWWLARGR